MVVVISQESLIIGQKYKRLGLLERLTLVLWTHDSHRVKFHASLGLLYRQLFVFVYQTKNYTLGNESQYSPDFHLQLPKFLLVRY